MGTALRPGSSLVMYRNSNKGGKGGTFGYYMEENLEMNCKMNFENYPMDQQTCYFKMLSPMYKHSQLVRHSR